MKSDTFHTKINGVDFEASGSRDEIEVKLWDFLRSVEPIGVVPANAKLKETDNEFQR